MNIDHPFVYQLSKPKERSSMVLPPTRLACLTASDTHLFSRQHQVDDVERPRHTMWSPPPVCERNSPCGKLFPSRQQYNAPAPAARPGQPRLAHLLCRLRRTRRKASSSVIHSARVPFFCRATANQHSHFPSDDCRSNPPVDRQGPGPD